MFEQTRITRRNFLKLNAALSGALALTAALPALAATNLNTPITSATAAKDGIDLPQPSVIRFGTPTDVAATWSGAAWSVDAEGVIHRFDRTSQIWLPDEADEEADFPAGSRFVLTRWGRPSGPNQMLMVLADAN